MIIDDKTLSVVGEHRKAKTCQIRISDDETTFTFKRDFPKLFEDINRVEELYILRTGYVNPIGILECLMNTMRKPLKSFKRFKLIETSLPLETLTVLDIVNTEGKSYFSLRVDPKIESHVISSYADYIPSMETVIIQLNHNTLNFYDPLPFIVRSFSLTEETKHFEIRQNGELLRIIANYKKANGEIGWKSPMTLTLEMHAQKTHISNRKHQSPLPLASEYIQSILKINNLKKLILVYRGPYERESEESYSKRLGPLDGWKVSRMEYSLFEDGNASITIVYNCNNTNNQKIKINIDYV